MEHALTQRTALLSTMDESRTDLRRRRIVDAGIAVQGNSNTMSAVEYLRTRDIGAKVIERVLLEPHLRRTRS
jgi:hypothetical protein